MVNFFKKVGMIELMDGLCYGDQVDVVIGCVDVFGWVDKKFQIVFGLGLCDLFSVGIGCDNLLKIF